MCISEEKIDPRDFFRERNGLIESYFFLTLKEIFAATTKKWEFLTQEQGLNGYRNGLFEALLLQTFFVMHQ